ncbi:MAG: L-serine ammonia-lyase, iron-sulfur-dependent, subunit alpha [Ignavibacteriales bacterium]|nr:L-serine ammonia-lyase, iron-sulfur-dependent, subunit alpha [Ignavibacteriales bacterium]
MEFNYLSEIVDYCRREGKDIAQAMVDYEIRNKGTTRERVYEGLKRILIVMEESVEQGLTQQVITPSGMLNNWAKRIYQSPKETLGVALKKAVARAVAVGEVNACMGKIAAAPTAGSAGIMPAVLVTMIEEHGISRQRILDALLVASAVGLVFAKNSSFAGSEAGCMGETGSAAAMAAASITYLLGGSDEQILESIGFALKASMGLVCDPVGGLVEEPCTTRNAVGVANAFVSAQMALAGIKSLIPADEVILATKEVGDLMSPKLKESGQGGLANTKTGREIQKKVFKIVKEEGRSS